MIREGNFRIVVFESIVYLRYKMCLWMVKVVKVEEVVEIEVRLLEGLLFIKEDEVLIRIDWKGSVEGLVGVFENVVE